MLVALVSSGGVMVPVGQQVAPIVPAPANLAGNLYNARGRREGGGKVFLGSLQERVLLGGPRGYLEGPRAYLEGGKWSTQW